MIRQFVRKEPIEGFEYPSIHGSYPSWFKTAMDNKTFFFDNGSLVNNISIGKNIVENGDFILKNRHGAIFVLSKEFVKSELEEVI